MTRWSAVKASTRLRDPEFSWPREMPRRLFGRSVGGRRLRLSRSSRPAVLPTSTVASAAVPASTVASAGLAAKAVAGAGLPASTVASAALPEGPAQPSDRAGEQQHRRECCFAPGPAQLGVETHNKANVTAGVAGHRPCRACRQQRPRRRHRHRRARASIHRCASNVRSAKALPNATTYVQQNQLTVMATWSDESVHCNHSCKSHLEHTPARCPHKNTQVPPRIFSHRS